jgi:hypothetical protein
LGAAYLISQVTIYNRHDRRFERLGFHEIWVSNSPTSPTTKCFSGTISSNLPLILPSLHRTSVSSFSYTLTHRYGASNGWSVSPVMRRSGSIRAGSAPWHQSHAKPCRGRSQWGSRYSYCCADLDADKGRCSSVPLLLVDSLRDAEHGSNVQTELPAPSVRAAAVL